MVAFALLGLLTALALGVITSMQQPTTEVMLRADMTTKGIGGTALMLREIEGGVYIDAANTVGNYASGGVPGITFPAPVAFVDPLDGSEEVTVPGSTPDMSYDNAVKFKPLTEAGGTTYVTTGTGSTTFEGSEVAYAFIPVETGGTDADRDGLIDEWKLVRMVGTTEVITIIDNIVDQGQFGPATLAPPAAASAYKAAHPALQDIYAPHFTLEHPSTLRVRFTTGAQTGYDTTTQTREFSLVTFDRTVFLRNQEP
jgi:hypothetical protein